MFTHKQQLSQQSQVLPSSQCLHYFTTCCKYSRNINVHREYSAEKFNSKLSKLGILNINDDLQWRKVGRKTIKKVLSIHNSECVLEVLKNSYPGRDWSTLQDHLRIKQYFLDLENRRGLLEQVGNRLNLVKLEDWYRVIYSQFYQNGGKRILHYTKGSMSRLLQEAYPNYPWDERLFTKAPHRYWESRENVVKFITELAKDLNLSSYDEWYKIKGKDFVNKKGGKSLLNIHDGKVFDILRIYFPEYNWDVLLSRSISTKFISIEEKRELFLRFIKHYCIQKPSDWYRISSKQVQKFCSVGFFNKLLKSHLCNWSHFKGQQILEKARSKKSTQWWLGKCIKMIFPNEYVLEDYEHPLFYLETGRIGELDLFIPSINLAFEYQGEQHYDDLMSSAFSPHEVYKFRDDAKFQLCVKNDVTIVFIPYWWDRNKETIVSYLKTELRASVDLHTKLIFF